MLDTATLYVYHRIINKFQTDVLDPIAGKNFSLATILLKLCDKEYSVNSIIRKGIIATYDLFGSTVAYCYGLFSCQ